MTTIVLLMLGLLPGPAEQPQRVSFDEVRVEFFAGLSGDDARMRHAMELCEQALAADPTDPQALVWHGSGTLFRSGQAFNRGDMSTGGELWARGLAEMDRAVGLAPDEIAVLIPRAATLLQATRTMPPDAARPLIESAVHDYEHVLELQASYFASLGDHPKGELLFGLAEGYARLGQPVKARAYFERLVSDAPGSGQAPRAREWLATGEVPTIEGLGCVGCHK